MDVKLTLNLRTDTQEEAAKERVKKATKAKKDATETVEAAFERIGTLKLSDKEREQYEIAKKAYFSGAIGRLYPEKKLSKGEVLTMAATVVKRRAEEMREKRIAETLRTKPDNYFVITDDSDLPRMMERLAEERRLQQEDEWFRKVFDLFNNTGIRHKLGERGIEIPLVQSFTAWDTETSGVDKMIDLTGGYSFWLPLLDEGYYVAYGHLTGEPQCTRSVALETIRAFIEDATHIKSFHNAEFDLAMLLNDGFKPAGVRYDSMDVQRILYDHEQSYGLKPLFTKYKAAISGPALDMDDFTFEDLFDKSSPMVREIEVVGIYAIKDVHKGWLLTKWQIDNMCAKDNLHVPYFEIRQYLPEVNVTIERTGFCVDLDELAKLGAEYREKHKEAEQKIFNTYQIDDAFLRKMSMTLKGDKINAWIKAQEARIAKHYDSLRKNKSELAKSNPATKKYAQLKERIAKAEKTPPIAATLENAPDYIREFNLSSNDHLAYLIYDHLGIKDRTKEIVKDKSKVRAVSNDVLERYFEEEPSLQPLAEYAKYDKLLGTYVEKIPEALDVDGRIHTSLRTVSTGRYGSSGYSGRPNHLAVKDVNDTNYLAIMRRLVESNEKVPKGTNVQNIPARTKEGELIRRTFKPDPGCTFLGSDLKAIEPRVQAHIMVAEFGDEIFAEMFRKKLDPYIEFASILFEVPKEVCSEDYYKKVKGTSNAVPPYRKLMKQLFLAEGYGQAFEQFYKSVETYGVTREHAERAYRKFDEVLPGFSGMVQSAYEHLRKYGWTATLWHQKRRFPEYQAQWKRLCVLMRKAGIRDKNDPELAKRAYKLNPEERTEFWQLIRETGRAERAAFNHRIQGTGANVLQLCMIRSYYECTLARGWAFNLTLHDEQKHSVPNEQLTWEAIELYNDIMRNTVTLECPLDCDTVIETEWMNEVSPEEWFNEN
ncbi:DNA polymerase [Aneurinibacillus migulanus]|uniref:DNA polymerase n=1 Tax=Aneurinibacillus migulanus TaxID=47500 RepID=UPI00209CA52A|nr:DNA polymerase [Aneurinibacillus migulanus]MCP1354623.1 DNA polymerase [Aneurinibacillus migulanus]